jgi:exodeoxyribonuclease VII small subunit
MAEKSYRQLSDALEKVLAELQDPEVDIDRALKLYEQGQKLIAELAAYLESAENKVNKLTASSSTKTKKSS